MKVYRIKINKEIFVKAVILSAEPLFQVMQTFDIEESAWFEEDKAKIYCDELNKAYNQAGMFFELEELGWNNE